MPIGEVHDAERVDHGAACESGVPDDGYDGADEAVAWLCAVSYFHAHFNGGGVKIDLMGLYGKGCRPDLVAKVAIINEENTYLLTLHAAMPQFANTSLTSICRISNSHFLLPRVQEIKKKKSRN